MSQNDDDDRGGARSWYLSNGIKILLAAVVIVAFLAINPGSGRNAGGRPGRNTPAVPHVGQPISHGALVQLSRTVFHAANRPRFGTLARPTLADPAAP